METKNQPISSDIRIEDELIPESNQSSLDALGADLYQSNELFHTDNIVNNLKKNSDLHILASALFGVNAATGSNQIFTSQTLVDSEEQKTPFSPEDLKKWNWLLTGIQLHSSNMALEERKEQMAITLVENNRYIEQAKVDLRAAKFELEDIESEIRLVQRKYSDALQGIYLFDDLAKASEAQKAEFVKRAPSFLSDLEFKRVGAERRVDDLKKKIELDIEKSIAIKENIKKLMDVNAKEMTESIKKEMETKFSNPVKVTECQFILDGSEKPIHLQCECGTISRFSLGQLPYYVGGDLYNDFSRRKKVDRDSRRNKMSGKVNIYKLPYSDREEFMFSRVRIPHIQCDNCKRQLLLPYECIESLAENGHLNDEWLVTEFESGKRAHFSQFATTSFGRKVQTYTLHITRESLFKIIAPMSLQSLKEKNIPLSSLSLRDLAKVNDAPTSRLGEAIMEKYSKFSENPQSFTKVNEEFDGHVYMLMDAIRTMSKDKNIGQFVESCSAMLYLYGIENYLTGSDLRKFVYGYEKNLDELKDLLFRFSINNFIESVIKSKPFFLFENDKFRPVVSHTDVLPHTTFVECYQDLMREYMLSKISNLEPHEFIKVQELFKRFAPIRSTFNFEDAVKKSDELVIELKKELIRHFFDFNCPSCGSKMVLAKSAAVAVCNNPSCANDIEQSVLELFAPTFKRYITNPLNNIKNTPDGYQFTWFHEMWEYTGLTLGDEKTLPFLRRDVTVNAINNITKDVTAVKEEDKKSLNNLIANLGSDLDKVSGEVISQDIDVSDLKKSNDSREQEDLIRAREMLKKGDLHAKVYFDEGEGREKLGIFTRGAEEIPYNEMINITDGDPMLAENPEYMKEYLAFKEQFGIVEYTFEEWQEQQKKKLKSLFE